MRLYQNRDWLFEQYWTNGLSTPEIGRKFGFGHSTIHWWLKKSAIPTRNLSTGQRGKKKHSFTDTEKQKISEQMTKYRAQFLEPKPYHNREWLYQKYVVEKLSSFKIAKICDDYGERIWYWIDKFQLDKRNKSEAVQEHYRQNPGARRVNWDNPDYIRKFIAGCQRKPSNPERIFDEMTPDVIRYVGDGHWWKTFKNGKHKNPDFIITGQDKVIEIFGDYWHRNDNPHELIEAYKMIGLDCLIIWEHEIYENPVTVCFRVNQFIQKMPEDAA